MIWLIIATIALLIDLITSSFLFVWFTLGGIVAIIADLLNYSFTIQLISFISVSLFFMIIGIPLVRETIKKTVTKVPKMEEKYIGREIIVDSDVIDKKIMKIDGIYWTVKNEGENIKEGDTVKIIGISGNKVRINKIKGGC